MPLVNCFIHILKFKMKIEVGSILKNKVEQYFQIYLYGQSILD